MSNDTEKRTDEGTSQNRGFKQLTREELEKLAGGPLPDRAAALLINASVAAPADTTLARNKNNHSRQ
jgi:hypothetical protein